MISQLGAQGVHLRRDQSEVLRDDREGAEGTFELTVLPPAGSAPPRPRDVVLVFGRETGGLPARAYAAT